MLQNRKGFTYIELIIVIAIFSIITVIIGTTFILFTRAQTNTSVREKLIADGRYIMETITRNIRLNRINFDAYTAPIQNPTSYLSLLDAEDNQISFDVIQGDCFDGIENCLFYEQILGGGLLSGEDVNIDYLKFYIQPTLNPFVVGDGGNYLSNQQPQVTVLLGISSKLKVVGEPVSIQLQTTVSSKQYVR